MTPEARAEPGVVRPTDVAAEPWRNGRGVTRVLVARPTWRISVAEIDGRAAFSEFAGFDRVLIPLDRGGLHLEIEGVGQRVAQHSSIAFRGEDRVTADSGDRQAKVVNVMVHRSCIGADWTVSIESGSALAGVEARDRPEADAAAAVALTGTVSAPDARPLPPGSVVLAPGTARIGATPHDVWAVLRLRPAAASDA
ncbi:HutD protein [Agromyces sp. CF514]|uniref:HutD family protein n=1 Tax=Agromyces sp. CF514 TaxID=1881031 RepID=UPI0008ED7F75|nr:HutD family protein [Agromyces sp. CF514]SFR66840.1 HutD protein [Agromyces sp. CF514]